jgi:hypothetical protein
MDYAMTAEDDMHSSSSNIKPPSKMAATFEDDIVMDEKNRRTPSGNERFDSAQGRRQ